MHYDGEPINRDGRNKTIAQSSLHFNRLEMAHWATRARRSCSKSRGKGETELKLF